MNELPEPHHDAAAANGHRPHSGNGVEATPGTVEGELVRAIEALPEAFRIAVVLADVRGFSYIDIAATLDVPVGTVRSRLARGRALLQKALWEHACDAGLRTETLEPPRGQP